MSRSWYSKVPTRACFATLTSLLFCLVSAPLIPSQIKCRMAVLLVSKPSLIPTCCSDYSIRVKEKIFLPRSTLTGAQVWNRLNGAFEINIIVSSMCGLLITLSTQFERRSHCDRSSQHISALCSPADVLVPLGSSAILCVVKTSDTLRQSAADTWRSGETIKLLASVGRQRSYRAAKVPDHYLNSRVYTSTIISREMKQLTEHPFSLMLIADWLA